MTLHQDIKCSTCSYVLKFYFCFTLYFTTLYIVPQIKYLIYDHKLYIVLTFKIHSKFMFNIDIVASCIPNRLDDFTHVAKLPTLYAVSINYFSQIILGTQQLFQIIYNIIIIHFSASTFQNRIEFYIQIKYSIKRSCLFYMFTKIKHKYY